MICVLDKNIRAEIAGHTHDLEANLIKNLKVLGKPAN